jgi:hypothetical protein
LNRNATVEVQIRIPRKTNRIWSVDSTGLSSRACHSPISATLHTWPRPYICGRIRRHSARERVLPRIAQSDFQYPLLCRWKHVLYVATPRLPRCGLRRDQHNGAPTMIDIRRPYYLALPENRLLHEIYWCFRCIIRACCAASAGPLAELLYTCVFTDTSFCRSPMQYRHPLSNLPISRSTTVRTIELVRIRVSTRLHAVTTRPCWQE